MAAGAEDLRAVMRVSARADYAVRLVVALALQPETVLSREHLAQAEGLPVKFVDHVLRQLRGGGILESRRGRHGGYLLARPPESITLAEVVRVMAEPQPPSQPPAQPAAGVPVQLSGPGRAGWLETMWSGVSTAVDAAMADVTVAVLRDARLAEGVGQGA